MATLVRDGLDISGTTANRPTAKGEPGQGYFDTDIKAPLVHNGTNWNILSGPSSSLAAAASVSTSGTIALPTQGDTAKLSTSGAVTGVILTAGVYDGQRLTLVNTSANSITFAAAGTSNVADGTSAVLAANRSMTLIWEATSARWYRQG
jgi:hypothetical protein